MSSLCVFISMAFSAYKMYAFCENRNRKDELNERWTFFPDPSTAPMRTMKSLLGFLQKHFPGQGQAFFRLIPLPHIFPEAHFAADQPGPLPWSHHYCLCSKELSLLLKLPVLKQNTVTGTLGVSPQTVSEGSHGVKRSQIPSTASTSPGLAAKLILVSPLWEHQPPFPCLLLTEMGRG